MSKLKIFTENVLFCFLQGSTKICRTDNTLSVQNFNWLQQIYLTEFGLKLSSFRLQLNVVVPRLFSHSERNTHVTYDQKATRKAHNIVKYEKMIF